MINNEKSFTVKDHIGIFDNYFITRIPLKNLKNYYENDYWRNYCIKNKERIKERHRGWYLKNRERILEHQKMYRENKI